MKIDINSELGALVVANPGFVPVLERYRLDFCCQGRQTLAEACRNKGVDIEQVVVELANLEAEPPEKDWEQAPLSELVEHIQKQYHEPLPRELAGLQEKAARIAQVHGPERPALLTVASLVNELSQELLHHTRKEDNVLFPWIRDLELGRRRAASLEGPVRMMEADHEDAGATLEALRSATEDYLIPESACTTYRLLFSGLQQFERELHLHIHLENAVLFPRALAMARG